MSSRIFSIALCPREVIDLLMREIQGDVLHHDYREIKADVGFGYIVFEQIYGRANIPITLVFHVENLQGMTEMTLVFSDHGEDWHHHLDWGEENEYMDEVMEILDAYILEEKKM